MGASLGELTVVARGGLTLVTLGGAVFVADVAARGAVVLTDCVVPQAASVTHVATASAPVIRASGLSTNVG
jgi:hypothetical protein